MHHLPTRPPRPTGPTHPVHWTPTLTILVVIAGVLLLVLVLGLCYRRKLLRQLRPSFPPPSGITLRQPNDTLPTYNPERETNPLLSVHDECPTQNFVQITPSHRQDRQSRNQ